MSASPGRRVFVVVGLVAVLAIGGVAVLSDRSIAPVVEAPTARPSPSPSATVDEAVELTPAPSGSAVSGPVVVPVGPSRDRLSQFRAPLVTTPLPNLDPGLASRGPRPTLADLIHYQYGNPAVIVNPAAGNLDWQLARPDPAAVRGYADELSVLPGQDLGLHLNGLDPTARVDVFRMGLRDGQHVLSLSGIRVQRRPEAVPRLSDGLVEEGWPRSATVSVGLDWRSGVYLAKLTGSSGGQSYLLFVVRPLAPQALTVVLPTMTYQAYNDYGGPDLYGWPNGPRPRAYKVSFNRPFGREWGAGLFFRLDFPLIVWLEDHGYAPAFIADADIARHPDLALGASTLIFSGHGEYWTGDMRTTVEGAAARGTSLGFFGANQAFWQARLESDGAGRAARTMVCYKSAALDPLASADPAAATSRFEQPPVNRPPSDLMGLKYGGVVDGIQPLVVGAGISAFDPTVGLRPGHVLPGLIADEVDTALPSFAGILLGATPVTVREHPGIVTAGAALWLGPAGNRVFDAGTFDFSWGLDPRYSADLPDFPKGAFARLTADILAWLGARPAP